MISCIAIKYIKISWLTWSLWDIYEICIMGGFNAWIYRGLRRERHLAAHPSLLVTHRTSPRATLLCTMHLHAASTHCTQITAFERCTKSMEGIGCSKLQWEEDLSWSKLHWHLASVIWHCVICTVCSLLYMKNVLCSEQYAPCSLHYVLWNMHCAPCTVQCSTMQFTTCTVPECRALVTVGEKVGNRQKSAGEVALTHVALQHRSIVAL